MNRPACAEALHADRRKNGDIFLGRDTRQSGVIKGDDTSLFLLTDGTRDQGRTTPSRRYPFRLSRCGQALRGFPSGVPVHLHLITYGRIPVQCLHRMVLQNRK